jgi:hypothetical protein
MNAQWTEDIAAASGRTEIRETVAADNEALPALTSP